MLRRNVGIRTHPMRARHVLLSCLFAVVIQNVGPVAAVRAAGPLQPTHYTLGRGLSIGNTGLTLGGYANLQYEDMRDEAFRFLVNTLSSQISWDLLSRVRFFPK